MSRLSNTLVLVACAVWLLGLTSCASTLLVKSQWVEVTTPHFMVIANLSEGDALELAEQMERFRVLAEFVTGQEFVESPVPTYVYAFGRFQDYERFAPENALGYFFSNVRQNFMVLPYLDRRERRRSAVFEHEMYVPQHEYVHFILDSDAKAAYPRWYHEGFAQALETAATRGDEIDIGRAPPLLRSWDTGGDRWVPLAELLSPEWREDRIESCYFESWGLVHYLTFGRPPEKRSARSQIGHYLGERSRGRSIHESVSSAFGMSVEELDRELRAYIDERRFPYVSTPADRFEVDLQASSRVLSQDEVSVYLGTLLVEGFASAHYGKIYHRLGLESGSDNPRVWAGLGDVAMLEGEWVEAEKAYLKALALADDDPLNHLDYAAFLHRLARKTQGAEARHELAKKARRHFVRAWKLDDAAPEAYAGYGATFLIEGEEVVKGRATLEHAYRVLPSDAEVQLSLAELYTRSSDQKRARALLHRVTASSHGVGYTERVEKLLAELDEASASARAAVPESRSGAISPLRNR